MLVFLQLIALQPYTDFFYDVIVVQKSSSRERKSLSYGWGCWRRLRNVLEIKCTWSGANIWLPLLFLTSTINDVRRKLHMVGTHLTVEKRAKTSSFYCRDYFVSSKLFELIPGVNLKLDLVVMQSGYVKNSKAEVFSVFLIWEKSNQKMYWWNEIKIFEKKEIWHLNIWIVRQFSVFWKHWKKQSI